MANLTSEEAYEGLVKLIGRAFYDDVGIDSRVGASGHNQGILVVILDHFARNQRWMRENEVAKCLKLSKSKLRHALCYLEDEKLVMRGEEGSQSYSLNYAQICNAVSYKLLKMKETLKKKHTTAEYICPNCDSRYTALDAATLISDNGEDFLCEKCRAEVVPEREKLGGGREIFKELQLKMEEQLKPLIEQLDRVKGLPIPEIEAARPAVCAESRDNPRPVKRNRDSP